MVRVNIICEGQTEESFVNAIIAPYFATQGIWISAPLIGKPGHKGGNVNWARLKRDLTVMMKNDHSVYCTTFLDFYGLHSDFPGKVDAERESDLVKKLEIMQEALVNAVTDTLGAEVATRFIPYIQMYEFEAILFSDPQLMEEKLNVSGFCAIRDQFNSPEHINNSSSTAPSKRIEKFCPTYHKVLGGTILAREMTLEKIKAECHLFHNWLRKLEQLKSR